MLSSAAGTFCLDAGVFVEATGNFVWPQALSFGRRCFLFRALCIFVWPQALSAAGVFLFAACACRGLIRGRASRRDQPTNARRTTRAITWGVHDSWDGEKRIGRNNFSESTAVMRVEGIGGGDGNGLRRARCDHACLSEGAGAGGTSRMSEAVGWGSAGRPGVQQGNWRTIFLMK